MAKFDGFKDSIAGYASRMASKEEAIGMASKSIASYVKNPATRIGVDFTVGGATGLVGAAFDKEDDSAGSVAKKMIVGAAGGYAVTELAVSGVTQYLKTEHAANNVAKAVPKIMPSFAGQETNIKHGVKYGSKLLPSSAGKFKALGMGAAAGLLYSATISGDGDGTFGEMATGAGLFLAGHELMSHKKSSGGFGSVEKIREAFPKIMNSATGKNMQDIFTELQSEKSFRKLSRDLGSIFSSEEGSKVRTIFEDVFSGKGKFDTSRLDASMGESIKKVMQDVQSYLTSDKGNARMSNAAKDFDKYLAPRKDYIAKDLLDSVKTDFDNFVRENPAAFKSVMSDIKELYSANQEKAKELAQKVVQNKVPAETVSELFDNQLPNMINQLDAYEAKKVTSQDVKKSNETAKTNSKDNADEQSLKNAKNHEKNSTVKSSHIAEADVKAANVKTMEKWKGRAGIAGIAAVGAFGLATMMDVSSSMSDKRAESRQVAKQEKNLTRKTNKEARSQRQYSHDNVDFGQMAIDMFNERIGHHKMGNSKFL